MTALDSLSPDLYDRLRGLAAAWLHRERPDHTHQPTSLVNEACLRMAPYARDADDLLPLAARVMRQILVDHARRRSSLKRGGDRRRVDLRDVPVVERPTLDVILVHEALADLEGMDPELARIVELKFFGGMAEAEIATCLGVSTRTVSRSWRVARLFLSRRLREAGA